jgi:shikimate kinase
LGSAAEGERLRSKGDGKGINDPSREKEVIHLAGPGGAGKTTTGALLAERLGASFVDLDAEFSVRDGDISAYLDTYGYDAYAKQNVGIYSTLIGTTGTRGVVALSSGFMTYEPALHPCYAQWRDAIASSDTTFVLLPSLDLETCVAEVVRRQVGRSFARTRDREERIIRTRFAIYAGLPATKVETMRPVDAVVADILSLLRWSTRRVDALLWGP